MSKGEKGRERPLSFSMTPAVPGTRPGLPPGGSSLGGSLAVGRGCGVVGWWRGGGLG